MRVNLIVPFEEKDHARQLGAKWDMARKVWFIENLDDLRPFLQWIPERLKQPCKKGKKSKKRV
jgi:hypothetical protein